MSHGNDGGLRPRNGHALIVGIVARISGCPGQKEVSLDDQADHARDEVRALYEGPTEYVIISTKGKGERLDRPELAQIDETIRTGQLDLLVLEDMGRLVRGVEAARLCGIAVDHGTRVISPNDGIDTADETFEEDVIAACRDHVSHNAHTSKRIKQKKMNRFRKFGGATPCEIYGYSKPEGAKTYADWQKDPTATPVYQRLFHFLKQTPNYSAAADMLNALGIPTGPYCDKDAWYGQMVRRVVANPILKGVPGRGFLHTVKHHETGRRKSRKNPKGPIYREEPHLAHVEAELWDEVNDLLKRKNAKNGRKPVNGSDPLLDVPRKRTRFPGQHATCWYCGHKCVWGGNGMTGNLMCKNARIWACWHSLGFDGALAATKIADAVGAELLALDDLDPQLRALAEEAKRAGNDLLREWDELRRDEAGLARDKDNVMATVRACGPRDMLSEQLDELEAKERELAARRRSLERRTGRPVNLPGSAELRELFREKMKGLAIDSPEFGDLLRLVAPQVHIYQVRLIDGGHLMSRARVELALAGIVRDTADNPTYGETLRRGITIDLFTPPQRECIREEAVRLAGEGREQRDIARRLRVTQTAVYRALALDHMMRERGLDNPYEVVMDPPDDYSKLRRHKNPRYKFTPAEEYQRPPI
jgi:DNA invertase Pin-like site-specific DNA recombinase